METKYLNISSVSPIFKSRRNQAYTMIVLSLFAMSFFGFMAVRPTLKTIATLKRKIIDNTEVNQKLEQKINALVQAQDEFKRIQPDLGKVYSLLPERAEFPLLLSKLENVAKVHNTTITNLQFEPILLYGTDAETPIAPPPVTQEDTTSPTSKSVLGETTEITPFNFELTFTGNYQDLIALLDRLTKFERLLTINSVQINFNENDASLVLVSQSEAFYYPLTL